MTGTQDWPTTAEAPEPNAQEPPSYSELYEIADTFAAGLTSIGVELGLPRPSADDTWGMREVLEKATELWTEHLHYHALRMGLRMILENGPLADGYSMTLYGPGDQQLVDQVHDLARGADMPRPLPWDGWQQVLLPLAHGSPPCVVLPQGWVIMPEMAHVKQPSDRPNPLFESGRPGEVDPASGGPDAAR